MRLDVFLTSRYQKFSRSFFQQVIKEGRVKVNGKVVTKAHHPVRDDDKITFDEGIFLEKKEPFAVDKKELFLIYEDSEICVIEKQPKTTVEYLQKANSGWHLVHRLDRDTSGLLVFAKNTAALKALQKQWKERKVRKEYIALLKGFLEPRRGRIEAPLTRSIKHRRKIRVSPSSKARESITEYKVQKYLEVGDLKLTLVHAYPLTGRTHQIRVHFSAIGYPVAGDNTYGDIRLNRQYKALGLERQFLHAHKLGFFHPKTKKWVEFKSLLPEDLKKVLGPVHRP